MENNIEESQRKYWKKKLSEAGSKEVEAVGSETNEHKNLRYQKVSEIIDNTTNFSILDVGAGIGDYFGFLSKKFTDKGFIYTGIEITEEFCEIARSKYPDIDIRNINILNSTIDTHDYVILSGLFHQHGDISLHEWKNFMEKMLKRSFDICRKGVVFRALNQYVDFKKEGNYYANIEEIITFLINELSRYIRIDFNYPLFEATYYVYQPSFIQIKYSSETFQKYIKK